VLFPFVTVMSRTYSFALALLLASIIGIGSARAEKVDWGPYLEPPGAKTTLPKQTTAPVVRDAAKPKQVKKTPPPAAKPTKTKQARKPKR
jgi:hypothetical protein